MSGTVSFDGDKRAASNNVEQVLGSQPLSSTRTLTPLSRVDQTPTTSSTPPDAAAPSKNWKKGGLTVLAVVGGIVLIGTAGIAFGVGTIVSIYILAQMFGKSKTTSTSVPQPLADQPLYYNPESTKTK